MTPRRPSSSWGRTATWRRSGCRRCNAASGPSRHPSRCAKLTRRFGRARRRWHGGRRLPGVTRGVVVTGASTGIGAAIARHLAGRGFRVFGTVRRAEDEAALERAGVTAVRMDVTDTASIARAREQVERALAGAPLAGLVNNAGIPAAGPLELFPLDELRRVLEVNLVGLVAVTQAFLPLLKASRGRIVNMSSVAGRSALPFLGPYAASKFGLEAMELGRYAGTPYESVLDRFRRGALRGAEQAPPPDKVVRAVWRALTAGRPPLRVIVTPHGWLDRIPLWIPDRWLDWLIHRFLWRGVRLPPS